MLPFADRLAASVQAKGNGVCVGLDPRFAQLPPLLREAYGGSLAQRAEGYRRFCQEIIDVVAELVPCVKPQAAFFEELGPAGMSALHEVIQYARQKKLLVLLDGKRNDIGSTAEAYANAYLGGDDPDAWQADAMTVSPYLGDDTLQPFVDRCHQTQSGIFVLVKTSNAGSKFLQDLRFQGTSIAELVADWVQQQASLHGGTSGFGAIGAVVGATYPEELAAMRERMPNAWLLIPGYGAQGGSAKDVAAGFDSQGLGAIVNSSRGIIFAHEKRADLPEHRWQQAVEDATRLMIQELKQFVSIAGPPIA